MTKSIYINGTRLGEGMPKICVPVIAHTFSELERSLKTLEKSCFDLVEFRADFYFEEGKRNINGILVAFIGYLPVLGVIWLREQNRLKEEEFDFMPIVSCMFILQDTGEIHNI